MSLSRTRVTTVLLAALAASLVAVALPERESDGHVGEARIARFYDDTRSGGIRTLSVPREPSDPLWSQAWSLRRLGLPGAWAPVPGAPAVIVGVVDTGVDAAHADLAGALLPGYDTLSGGVASSDENGHGTAVAGVIAARADNGVGVTGICGACLVLPVKVIGAAGTGDGGRIAEGIVWAVDQGARVVNLSIVLDGPEQSVEAAIRYATDRGVVVVAAAGNGGGLEPTYPASYPGVIGVAAAQQDGSLYPWTQRGPWVDVAAPGCSPSTARAGEYTMFCGTSSASASVAGVLALALSLVPAATRDDLERALAETAAPLPGVGAGNVDAAALVDSLQARSSVP